MIDAKPVNLAVADQFEQQRMHRLKHLGIFYPNGGKLVDIEEAAVIDFVRRDLPEGRAGKIAAPSNSSRRSKLWDLPSRH